MTQVGARLLLAQVWPQPVGDGGAQRRRIGQQPCDELLHSAAPSAIRHCSAIATANGELAEGGDLQLVRRPGRGAAREGAPSLAAVRADGRSDVPPIGWTRESDRGRRRPPVSSRSRPSPTRTTSMVARAPARARSTPTAASPRPTCRRHAGAQRLPCPQRSPCASRCPSPAHRASRYRRRVPERRTARRDRTTAATASGISRNNASKRAAAASSPSVASATSASAT